jgi:hypothetical protein
MKDGFLISPYQEVFNRTVEEIQQKGPVSLRGHLVNGHFHPFWLGWMGVASIDIEAADKLQIPLDWVVKKAYKLLQDGWPDDQKVQFDRPRNSFQSNVWVKSGKPWGEEWCKEMVVKNMLYIDQLGLSLVDWEKVVEAMPNLDEITLDLKRDSYEPEVKIIRIKRKRLKEYLAALQTEPSTPAPSRF